MIHATGNISVAGSHKRWNDLRKGVNCKLLIHSNTTDGSTTFVDSVGTHNPSGAGTAQHDTAQHKWGTSAILLDGNSDFITINDHADFNLGSGEFTIDFWLMFSSVPASNIPLFSQETDGSNAVVFFWVGGGAPQVLRLSIIGASTVTVDSGTWIPTQNVWYHIAITRSGNEWSIWINGIKSGTSTTDADAWSDFTGPFLIGEYAGGYFPGWIDEFRLIKGTAVWTKTFLPPIGPYI